MKSKPLFLGILLLLLLSGCRTELFLLGASQQSWAGGQRGSGRGIDYKVELKKPDNNDLTIEKVWFGDREKGKWMSPEIQLQGQSSQQGLTVRAGKANFTLMFKEFFPGEVNGQEATPEPPLVDADPSLLPDDFEKGAVIFFSLPLSNVKTLIVKDFTVLEPIAYP